MLRVAIVGLGFCFLFLLNISPTIPVESSLRESVLWSEPGCKSVKICGKDPTVSFFSLLSPTIPVESSLLASVLLSQLDDLKKVCTQMFVFCPTFPVESTLRESVLWSEPGCKSVKLCGKDPIVSLFSLLSPTIPVESSLLASVLLSQLDEFLLSLSECRAAPRHPSSQGQC